MIVDTSALVAIVRNEVHADDLLAILYAAPSLRISASNLLEAYIVADDKENARSRVVLEQLLEEFGLIVEPVTEAQVDIARTAYATYGKGRHPARLNYGDCFAYALAKAMNEPLLFIGNDFSQTDIAQAL